MSIYFQDSFNLSPLNTGLLLICTTGVNFIVALNIHKLLKSQTNISVLIKGILISIVGMILLIFCLNHQVGITMFILPLILIGVGQGFIFTPLTNLGVYQVTNEQSGIASGLVNLAHQIGSSAGIVFELVIATTLLHILNFENNNSSLTLISMVIGTVIQIIMLLYVLLVFKKKENKYEI